MKKNMLKVAAACALSVVATCANAGLYTPGAAINVSTVGFNVNGIAYDAATNELLAALPSADGVGLGNTLTALSNTGAVLSSTYVGSEPTAIGLSADGSTAYVGMMGSSLITQYDVATHTAGYQINLGMSAYLGPNYAAQIRVSPTNNSMITVALRNQGYSPSSNGVAVYNNGVIAPNQLSSYQADVTSIAYTSPNTIYGFNADDTGFDLYKMAVDSSGVSLLSDTPNGLGSAGFSSSILSSDGLIYSSNGVVFDPSTGYVLGTYNSPNASSLVAVDPVSSLGIVFAIDSSGHLLAFDQKTFVPISSRYLGSVSALPSQEASLQYMNNGSLAYLSGSNNLYILSAVPLPGSFGLFLGGLALIGVGFGRRKRSQ